MKIVMNKENRYSIKVCCLPVCIEILIKNRLALISLRGSDTFVNLVRSADVNHESQSC